MTDQAFIWDSAAMKRYSHGDIIAIAADVEAAREAVRARARKAADDFIWSGDAEELAAFLAKIEEDIAREPRTDTVFFIAGSE